VIDRAERLKVIGRTGVKSGDIDVPPPKASLFSAALTWWRATVYEHTLALPLAHLIHKANRTLAKGRWNAQPFMGVSLDYQGPVYLLDE